MALTLSGGLLASACGASLGSSAPSEANGQMASERSGGSMDKSNLPISARFRTLDDYLEYLERTQGPVDGPWYKMIGSDMYELQTGNLKLDGPDGADQKRVFTRQELEKKFGFSK